MDLDINTSNRIRDLQLLTWDIVRISIHNTVMQTINNKLDWQDKERTTHKTQSRGYIQSSAVYVYENMYIIV